jgi:hypothetical protein
MLYLIYFPTEPDLVSSAASITSTAPPKRRDAVVVGVATLLALLVVGITSIAMVASFPHHTQGWANFLGTVAGVLAAILHVQDWRREELEHHHDVDSSPWRVRLRFQSMATSRMGGLEHMACLCRHWNPPGRAARSGNQLLPCPSQEQASRRRLYEWRR